MSNLNFRKRRNRRGFFFHLSRHLPTFIVLFVIALVLGGGIFAFSRFVLKKQPGDRPVFATASEATKSNGTPSASAEADPDDPIGQLIDQADRLAKGYDYDKAMELLSQDPSIQSDPRISEALASFQSQKDSLVAADVKNVTHVFFHSLIMDTSKAFDGDSRMEGYNSVMTTKDEFLKILDALYNDGYVLVRIHDIAYETTDENGNPAFTWGTIMLPEGKIPFVLSEDDVSYYHYMDGDGFATKLVIDDNGDINPECEEAVMNELRGHFRPEFLNRIDEILVFHPLTTEQMQKIVGLMCKELVKRAKERMATLEYKNLIIDSPEKISRTEAIDFKGKESVDYLARLICGFQPIPALDKTQIMAQKWKNCTPDSAS